ncbi:MAG: glycosyltransferase family 2 protein [Chloroflexi bacterium]|nr:glycosyltransferase family 2 protein [Chloroflexota bacterium]
MKISIIIPAYNEAEGVTQTASQLAPVLEELSQDYTVEVIFVDDGSKDDTQRLLREHYGNDARVNIIPHDVNRGLGAAIRTGFQNTTGDMLVTTDFDGTYAFSNIPLLVKQLMADEVDIVTASPYHPDGGVEGVPRYRLLFSFGASLLYRLLVKWRIYTWTALFRAYRRRVIEGVSFESDDFLAGTELLVNAIRSGYSVSEFPTVLRTRSFGQSSIKIARVTKAHLQFQFRLIWLKLTRRFSLANSSSKHS